MERCSSRSEQSPQEWMSQTCQHVIGDLQTYGICVLDNFMGKERAESIHGSILNMYNSGVFIEGKTVGLSNNNSESPGLTKNVRNDQIAWVDGSENNCHDIGHLMATVDTIIFKSIQTMIENKRLEKRVIGGRTKAMISCYPGNGSYYVKHVDNPNRDGRFLTTTYYVNKDWDTKIDGGMLRVFPEGWSNQVLDIEPILDRVVFFWSDRRNPHEVQPSFRTRCAVTFWYMDAKEREEAETKRSHQPTS